MIGRAIGRASLLTAPVGLAQGQKAGGAGIQAPAPAEAR